MTSSIWVRGSAELVGTAVLVGIGTGSIVAGTETGGVPQWVLALAWFAAVAIPVQAFAFVSGAHLNPAVTLGLVASGRFPRREAPLFIAAQVGGAFVGSLGVWSVLGDAAHLGATLPGPRGPFWIFPLELIFTVLLLLSVLFLTGLRRRPTRAELLLPALVVGVSTWIIGPWTGSSLNPARSIAPAALSGDYSWLWVYLVASAVSVVVVGILGARGGAAAPRAESSSPVEAPRSPDSTVGGAENPGNGFSSFHPDEILRPRRGVLPLPGRARP